MRTQALGGVSALTIGSALVLSACGGGDDAPPVATATSPAASLTATPDPVTPPPTPAAGPTSSPKPGAKATTSYAQLTDFWKASATGYAVSYDKVDLLTGKAAADYYKAHPDLEPADWAVSNVNPALRQMPAATTATFYGGQLLGAGSGATLKKITGAQLASAVAAHPRTLVKVSEQPVGNHREVVKIVEVYLP